MPTTFAENYFISAALIFDLFIGKNPFSYVPWGEVYGAAAGDEVRTGHGGAFHGLESDLHLTVCTELTNHLGKKGETEEAEEAEETEEEGAGRRRRRRKEEEKEEGKREGRNGERCNGGRRRIMHE